MNEKVSRNPLKINENDGLGTIVLKTVARASIQTVATYGGTIGTFAVIGYFADRMKSKKEKKEGYWYEADASTADGFKFKTSVRAFSEEDARSKYQLAEGCTIESIRKIEHL